MHYIHCSGIVSNSQVIGCEDCLRNDLYCVGWGVKLCSIQSTAIIIIIHHYSGCTMSVRSSACYQ